MNNYLKIGLIVLVAIIFLVFIIYTIVGFVQTLKVRAMPEQAEFTNGTFPNPLPNGDLKGIADGQGNWLGKSFDSETHSGINRFKEGDMINRTAKFVTYKGKGINDPNLDVLKIDYNLPENPIYLRFVLDEVVEVAPGKYLGKLQLRIIPFVPFTLGYFRLEQ